MPIISGRVTEQHGAAVFVKVMQSPQLVAAIKKLGLRYTTPTSVLAILDTGASCSALDGIVVAAMALQYHGPAEIHTPSTGSGVEHRDTFDASLVLGETESTPLTTTVPVISCEFASRGFYALIGRDILRRCVLTYDGPGNTFQLEWPD